MCFSIKLHTFGPSVGSNVKVSGCGGGTGRGTPRLSYHIGASAFCSGVSFATMIVAIPLSSLFCLIIRDQLHPVVVVDSGTAGAKVCEPRDFAASRELPQVRRAGLYPAAL
jgi:hypothetical protein